MPSSSFASWCRLNASLNLAPSVEVNIAIMSSTREQCDPGELWLKTRAWKQVKRMRGRTVFEVYEKRGERRCNVNESSVCTAVECNILINVWRNKLINQWRKTLKNKRSSYENKIINIIVDHLYWNPPVQQENPACSMKLKHVFGWPLKHTQQKRIPPKTIEEK